MQVPPLASYVPSKKGKRSPARVATIQRRTHRPQHKRSRRHHGDDDKDERSGEEKSL